MIGTNGIWWGRFHDRAVPLEDIRVIRRFRTQTAWHAGVAGRDIRLAQDCHRKAIGRVPSGDLYQTDLGAGRIRQADKSKTHCYTFQHHSLFYRS